MLITDDLSKKLMDLILSLPCKNCQLLIWLFLFKTEILYKV